MSDASENDDMISITVDGQSVQARKGQMIIEVTCLCHTGSAGHGD